MALKKYAALVVSFVAALFLDTAVLPKWNLFELVPFVMLALIFVTMFVTNRFRKDETQEKGRLW